MKITKDGITAPKGFLAAGDHVGIKKVKKDLAILYSKKPAICSAVFTKNVVKAAPLQLALKVLAENRYISAIAINSGNANACTGEQGYKDAITTSKTLADCLGLKENEVLVSSTGVIGQLLDIEKLTEGVKTVCKELSDSKNSANDCAEAIMTTDTVKKEIAVEIEIDGKKVTVGGMCKGSGMIHPNMCTMLGYVATDAVIEKDVLTKLLKEDVVDTYNMISVDGDTSTNDTLLVMANGMAGNPTIKEGTQAYEDFKAALHFVNETQAKRLAGDGEGATALIECKVFHMDTKQNARTLAKSVICSSLTKAAVYGHDANWGRILCALGYSGASFDPENMELYYAAGGKKMLIYKDGADAGYSEEEASEILSRKEVQILVDMKMGQEEATAWGCDLTYDYVKINADYRS